VTDGNGDGDKQIDSKGHRASFARTYEEKVTKVALANLFLQKEIESARYEYAKLTATIKAAEEHLENASAQAAPSLPKRSTPPATATFILAFMAPKNSAQAYLGDLEEVFHKNEARFGERQARRQYWMQVASSFGPLLWQWLKRIGFFTVLIHYFRSKFGL
jgi:hypothetical protein